MISSNEAWQAFLGPIKRHTITALGAVGIVALMRDCPFWLILLACALWGGFLAALHSFTAGKYERLISAASLFFVGIVCISIAFDSFVKAAIVTVGFIFLRESIYLWPSQAQGIAHSTLTLFTLIKKKADEKIAQKRSSDPGDDFKK